MFRAIVSAVSGWIIFQVLPDGTYNIYSYVFYGPPLWEPAWERAYTYFLLECCQRLLHQCEMPTGCSAIEWNTGRCGLWRLCSGWESLAVSEELRRRRPPRIRDRVRRRRPQACEETGCIPPVCRQPDGYGMRGHWKYQSICEDEPPVHSANHACKQGLLTRRDDLYLRFAGKSIATGQDNGERPEGATNKIKPSFTMCGIIL